MFVTQLARSVMCFTQIALSVMCIPLFQDSPRITLLGLSDSLTLETQSLADRRSLLPQLEIKRCILLLFFVLLYFFLFTHQCLVVVHQGILSARSDFNLVLLPYAYLSVR